MPKTIGSTHQPGVPTWTELNRTLGRLKTERAVEELIARLRFSGASPRWLRRAAARARKLRYTRERAEFERGLIQYKGPRRKKDENAAA